MDAKYDANFNPNMLAYNPATDTVENVKSNAAGDAILVELVAMVNEYKTAISGADTTPNYLEDKLVAGSGITITKLNVGGNEQLQLDASGLGYYQEVQQDGIAFTQRNSLNFTSFFDVTDNAGNDSTDVTVDVTAIASDNTFISALTSTATFLENIANSSIFVDTLIGNTYFLDELVGSTYFTTLLANDSNFISELTSNSTFLTEISGNVEVVTDGVTITGSGTTADPLVAVGGGSGSGSELTETITQTSHGFIVGDVVGSNNTANEYKKVISLNTDNMPIGFVTTVTNANSFIMSTSGFATITPSLLTTFANGDIIWHSTTVSGGITVTKPTSGVVRKLGVVIDKTAGKVYVDIDSGFENGSTTNILGLQNGELFVGKSIVPLGFYKTTNYNFVETLDISNNSNDLELSLSILYKPVLQKFDLTGFLVATLTTPDTLLVPTSPTDFEYRYTTDGTYIYALSVYTSGGLRKADIAKYDLSFTLINIVNIYSNSSMSIATDTGSSPAFRGSAFNITNGYIYMNLSFTTNVSTFEKRNIDSTYSLVNSSTATTTSFTQIYGNGNNIYLLKSGSTFAAEIDKWDISGATATSLGPIGNTVFKLNYNNNPVSGYNNIMGNLYQNGSDVSIPVFKVTIDHYRAGSSSDLVAWFIETVEDKIIYTL